MTYETIRLERDGALAILTLNRPEKMNSLSDQLLADFRAAMDACERDENVRSMIITGAGTGEGPGGSSGGAVAAVPKLPFVSLYSAEFEALLG